MHRSLARPMALGLVLAVGSACGGYGSDPDTVYPALDPTTLSATGDIAARVEEFRTLLGGPANGGTAGDQAAGRREISWDGAGANPFNNRNDFPAAFFNTTVKSGAVFSTSGTGFRNDSLLFAEVNAAYAKEFAAFSPTKLFAPVGANVMDVLFQVAGGTADLVVVDNLVYGEPRRIQ